MGDVPAYRLSTAFVVKVGYASFKQDGLIAMWNKRWIILREDQLSWHRSEVRHTDTQTHERRTRPPQHAVPHRGLSMAVPRGPALTARASPVLWALWTEHVVRAAGGD
jgi:hypothetical protein